MSKTPDRFPGEREDEGLVISDEGIDPDKLGEVRYSAGDFKMKDHLGVFNPRTSGGGGYTATHTGQFLASVDGATFVPALPVIDDQFNVVVDDQYEIVVTT